MDEIDRAQSETEVLNEVTINQYRTLANQPEVEGTGFCLYCEEPLSDGKRWCDSYCRDEWENSKKSQNIYRPNNSTG